MDVNSLNEKYFEIFFVTEELPLRSRYYLRMIVPGLVMRLLLLLLTLLWNWKTVPLPTLKSKRLDMLLPVKELPATLPIYFCVNTNVYVTPEKKNFHTRISHLFTPLFSWRKALLFFMNIKVAISIPSRQNLTPVFT